MYRRLLNSLLTTLNKSLRTSLETNFRLIEAFNWSKNNFGEIVHISQGLNWAFLSVSQYSLLFDCQCIYFESTY